MAQNLPPRQKMINMLYVIFIAILAVSLSQDSLDNFDKVYQNNLETVSMLEELNSSAYLEVIEQIKLSPSSNNQAATVEKIKAVRASSKELSALLSEVRETIIKSADKKSYTADRLKNKIDVSVVSKVLFNEESRMIDTMKLMLCNYQTLVLSLVSPGRQRIAIDSWMSSLGDLSVNSLADPTWGQSLFDHQSAIGGVILVNQAEEGVLMSENIVYNSLLEKRISGELEYLRRETDSLRTVTIANLNKQNNEARKNVTLIPKVRNRLYLGVETPINIIVGGLSGSDLILESDNGSAKLKNNEWYLTPTDGSRSVNVSIYSRLGGAKNLIDVQSFSTVELPDPSTYITYYNSSGLMKRYKGYTPVAYADIAKSVSLTAELTKESIDARFIVVGYKIVVSQQDGRSTSIEVKGSTISEDQRRQLQHISSPEKMYFTSIIVVGPDGVERTLPTIDVVLI